MVILNKNNQAAIEYVTKFINGQWFDDSGRYIGLGFDDGAFNKAKLKNYCLQEQENVCCYCSREIDNSPNTQLEHIIPRANKINQETLDKYFLHSQILADNIVLQYVFSGSTSKQKTPPFPHHIAYHNIAASCNGITFKTSEDFTCCNRNREDYFIPPYNLIQNNIVYLHDGTIYSNIDTTYQEQGNQFKSITHLNLNKQILKNIRRIWFLLANTDVDINELLQAITIAEFKEIFTLYLRVNPLKVTGDNNLIDSFENETTWKILMQYKYFLTYFRNNN